MKIKTSTFFFAACLILVGCNSLKESSQGKDFTSKVDGNVTNEHALQYPFFDRERHPIQARFEFLSAGDIKPRGWLFAIMNEDVTSGFVGELDNLAPDIMKGDDLFNTTRRKDPTDIPDVGDQILTGAAWEISMQWWSGETLGNWWDGLVRHGFLTDNEAIKKRSEEIVEYLMSTQDDDGYFGIYGPAMRYQHDGSNGELWTKTTVLRMMLGYYEYTKDKQVLEFVERTMANTMEYYNKDAKSPFNVKVDYGGVTHGLMMTDVCEMLYRITGKKEYSDYAVFLYEDFSEYPINRAFNDACYGYLMEKDSLFQSHSAHTYEHLRSVIHTYYATGYPEMKEAYESALNKLSHCILPSGAGFGNEWLNREHAKPSRTGAEVCGMNELKDFYLHALQKSGDISFADDAERLTFNGLMGARNIGGTAITYCKTDNCYILNRKSPQSDFEESDPRYKYSPTHADAAVCCNPSYAKYYPYYVGSMWMKAEDGLTALLYGPCILETTYGGEQITIDQRTGYPFSDAIKLVVTTSAPTEFTLYFRKPTWVRSMSVEAEGSPAILEEGYYRIRKQWQSGDQINIRFDNKVQARTYHNGEIYFQKGPLVFAYEISHKTENVKDYQVEGFHDYYCYPTDETYEGLALAKGAEQEFEFFEKSHSDDAVIWHSKETYLQGPLHSMIVDKPITVKLVPMGSTALRRVTFPLK